MHVCVCSRGSRLKVSEMERQRREAYLKKQREALLDMQRVKREEEMNSYLKEHQRVCTPCRITA